MVPLMDTSPKRISQLAAECGFGDHWGQLQTPLTGYRNCGWTWAADNGCYSRFEPERYLRFLEKRLEHLEACLWATVPDAVGDCWLTQRRWLEWSGRIRDLGYPLAYVLQDGITLDRIPKNAVAWFVGGTTEWKLNIGPDFVRAGKERNIWVHIGRVNTGGRYLDFARLGADSFDGSGLVRPYPGFKKQRENLKKARSQFLREQGVLARGADATGSKSGVVVNAD